MNITSAIERMMLCLQFQTGRLGGYYANKSGENKQFRQDPFACEIQKTQQFSDY